MIWANSSCSSLSRENIISITCLTFWLHCICCPPIRLCNARTRLVTCVYGPPLQVISEQRLNDRGRTERKDRKARHRLRTRLPPRRSKQRPLKPSELRLFVHCLE